MSKKVFRTVASIATVAVAIAAAIPTGGASLTVLGAVAGALGTSAAVLTAGAMALTIGSSLLLRPKAPATSSAATDRLSASIDPRTPRKFVLGRTAMATDIRDQEFSDNQQFLHRFVVVASHKVSAIREIWLDEKLAWTATGGIQGEFLGYLGVEGYADGNPANAKNISARMGSSRRYTGLAWVYLRFKLTGNSKKAESPFAQSVPSRVTIVGDGAFVYDPRLDSTVPGGSGPCRVNDQSTWIWSDNAARNPALQLLWYLLGWRIQNPSTGEWRLAVGKGIPAARIDLTSFITAANLCDEPVSLAAGGTQPRYRSDGVFSEGDATNIVLDQLKASMNAELDDVDGNIRITVLHNDLATPIATFTEDDILTGFTWDQTAPLDETFNVVRGTFIDPSNTSLYQAVDYPEVRIASPDGIDRVETVDFQTVQDPRQAQRLVKQRIARMLYSGRFTATFGYRAWKVQKNDVIRLTFSPLGWTNKLFRVVETAVQVDGQVPMVLQVENADIYLWDRDERPAIQPVQPTTYDPFLNPIYQDVVDPKYGDGTSINDLRPAEPGATNGMNPDEAALLAQLEADTAQALIDIAAAEQTVIAMQSEVAAIEADVLAAQADILANATDITTLSTAQASQGAAITSLQVTASSLQGDLSALTNTVSTQGASITTQQTAITALQGSVSTLSTRVSAFTASMNLNANFGDWASGTWPARWGSYFAFEGTVTKVPGNYGSGVRVLSTAPFTAFGQGFWTWTGTAGQHPAMESAGPGYYIIEAEVTLESGALTGSGLRLQGYDNTGTYITGATRLLTFSTDPDNTGVAPGAGTVGKTYRFAKFVQLPNAGIASVRLVNASHADDLGAEVSKTLVWHRSTCRAATESEIAAGVALPALEATVSTQASALSTLTAQQATLSSTVSTQGSSITTMQGAITTLQGNVATLNTTVTAQGSSITTMQTALSTATSDVATLKTQVRTGGGNLLTNTNLSTAPATTGWLSFSNNGTVFPVDVTANFVVPGNPGVLIHQQNGTTTGFSSWYQRIQIEGGKWYEISGLVATNQSNLQLILQWEDATGAIISSSSGPSTNHGFGGTGTDNTLAKYTPVSFKAQAPANARQVAAVFRKHGTLSGSDSWARVLRPQFAETTAAAGPISYSPGNEYATVSTMQASVNGIFARYGVELDVNGYVTGFVMNNNGSRGDFTIRADKFAIVAPGGGARTEYSGGNWRVYYASGNLAARFGVW